MTPLPLHLTVILTAAGQPTIGKPLIGHAREALIKSLSDFILEFLFNARNKSTRIASYLRILMRSIG